MKNYLLAGTIAMMIATTTTAQMPYNIAVQQQPYQPLAGATVINDTTWDDEDFVVPLGFTMNINGQAVSMFTLSSATSVSTDSTGTIDAFSLIGVDLIDRGYGTANSKSPIRYQVTGPAGLRIFKAEVSNAGFADEMYNYSTLDDSVNIQVWLYEGTNAVEIHYGDARISHGADYFPFGGPLVGFVRDADMDSGTFGKLYVLNGNPLSPTVDSIEDGGMTFPALSSYPPPGTVYTFTLKTSSTSVNDLMIKNVSVYPSQSADAIYISNTGIPDTYYQVISLNGTVVKNGRVENGNTRIDISNLSAGMYILRMDNVIGYDLRKFVKL